MATPITLTLSNLNKTNIHGSCLKNNNFHRAKLDAIRGAESRKTARLAPGRLALSDVNAVALSHFLSHRADLGTSRESSHPPQINNILCRSLDHHNRSRISRVAGTAAAAATNRCVGNDDRTQRCHRRKSSCLHVLTRPHVIRDLSGCISIS